MKVMLVVLLLYLPQYQDYVVPFATMEECQKAAVVIKQELEVTKRKGQQITVDCVKIMAIGEQES